MRAPPLAELYDLLRASGFAIGVDDHLRISKLTARDAAWTPEMLRVAIAALVITDPGERGAFDACWARWLHQVEPTRPPPPTAPATASALARGTARRVRVLKVAIVGVILAFAVAALIIRAGARTPSLPESPPDSAPIASREGLGSAAHRNDDRADRGNNRESGQPDESARREHASVTPAAAAMSEQAPTSDTHAGSTSNLNKAAAGTASSGATHTTPTQAAETWLSLSGAVNILLLAVVLGAALLVVTAIAGAFGARARRRFLPGPWHYRLTVPAVSAPVLPQRAIEDAAADLSGQPLGERHELDVAASIAATVSAGGLLTIVHRVATGAPRYLVLEDAVGGERWRFLYDELFHRLALEGVKLERYTFSANPTRCDRPDGGAALLDELLDHADALVVISDGETAVNPLSGARANWLASLRHIPRRLWINPLPPGQWSMGAHAIAAETPMKHGVARALTSIGSNFHSTSDVAAAAQRPWQRPGSGVDPRALRDDRAFSLVAALAMTCPPTIAAARWLAQRLVLELDEEEWLGMVTLPWFTAESWPPELPEQLREALTDRDAELAHAAAAAGDSLLSASEPRPNSAAHLVWRIECARRAAQRGERDAAAYSLNQIAGSPLASQARAALADLGLPDRERRVLTWAVAFGSALIAGALAFGVVPRLFGWLVDRVPTLAGGDTTADAFAGLESQPYEIRLVYPGAAAKRPVRDAMLGSGAAPNGNAIPLEAVAALQKRGDLHGVAIAELWNGRKPKDVYRMLSAIEQTEPVRSDRAAIAVLTTDAANAEPVLAELESLRRSKDNVVARAARWNYALALAHLDLPLAEAQAFRDIADEHEPGWAEEAAKRAEQQARLGDALRAKWQRAREAGEALVKDGTSVPRTLVSEFPGVLRAYLYNAVRTAPSAERVRALAPMAAQLDQLGDPGQHILTDYVQRVAKLDFARRAPLAAGYAALLRGAPVSDPIAAQLTTETDNEAITDIVMGAMVERDVQGDVITGHRQWFQRRVNQYQDLWFQLVLSRAEADVAWTANPGGKAGNLYRAQTILQKARELCTPALRYQCLELDRYLGELYADLHQVPASLTLLRRTVADARAAGEWGRYQDLLMDIADVERLRGGTATVRAYASELLRMPATCKGYKLVYRRLAGAAILDADGSAARDYLAQAMALPCAGTDLPTAIYFSDIATLDPRLDDLAQLQRMLDMLPATSKATVANQALIAALEGRVAIATERDRAGGVALLEKAIASADARRGDVSAEKARSASYSMLAFDAVQRNDVAGALDLMARDLRQTLPGDCLVAMAAEGKRAVIVVRGADGKDRGRYFPERLRQDSALSVPADLAQGLAGCPHVGVMASAALQGQPGVLPAELAWSYTVQAVERVAASNPPPDEPHTLIVTNVRPPPYLELQPLPAQPPDDVFATTLSGAAATPTRVLAAMVGATEIQFHTHALLDVSVSDASHLVLSPEESVRGTAAGRADPPYALTAEAIRGARLLRRPIVVLDACHSAVGARYEHEPWSLPDAFLVAGARAVFAAATEIPDVASGQFFARVLARVRDGAAPAVALRDERIAALRKDPHNPWVASVILFE